MTTHHFDLSRLPSGIAPAVWCAVAFLTASLALVPGAAATADTWFCTADCLGRGGPRLQDVQLCQQIAAGSAQLSQCPPCDCDSNGVVSSEELDKAQRNFSDGCPNNDCPRPTPTATLRPDETRPPTATAVPTTPTPTAAPATATATGTAASTPTNTLTGPTATPGPQDVCLGDCDEGGTVAVNELVTGVNIALDRATLDRCPSFDGNSSLQVEVNELVIAVNHSLMGCP